jgi:toxin YoeB
MKIAFTEAGWEDYLWFQQNDHKRLKRINALIKDTIFYRIFLTKSVAS